MDGIKVRRDVEECRCNSGHKQRRNEDGQEGV